MHRTRSIPSRITISFLLIVVILPYLCGPALAQDSDPDGQDQVPARDLSSQLGLDLRSLTSRTNLMILGAAGVASAFAWEETDEHQSAFRRSLDGSSVDGLLDLGNLYGSGWFVGGLSVGSVAAGELSGNEGMTRFGTDLGRSFVYSAAATWVIKLAVDRPRPSGGPHSFPSGHTTSAFSTVPVVWHHAGWAAGLGSGFLACTTALGRMEENRHYASDVIFGATIGLVFGRAVISQRERTDWADHLVVTDRSVAVVWRF